MASYFELRAKLVRYVKARPLLFQIVVWTRPLRRVLSYPIKAGMVLVWIMPFLPALRRGRKLFLPVLHSGLRPAATPGSGGLPPQIVMLVISEVWRDPRVEREARALAASGFRVKVVYPDFFSTGTAARNIDWGAGIEFRPLPGYYHSFIHSFPYVFGSDFLEALHDERPFAFHAHDLTTALIGLAAAQKANAYCMCDFHEWYSENVSWDARRNCHVPHPWLKKMIYKLAELVVMHRASAIVTVCDSIANDLNSGRYLTRRKIEVIRNIPSLARVQSAVPHDLRKEIDAAEGQFVVLWQGGVGPTRLLEPIIEAFEYIPRGVLAIRGPGITRFGKDYLELARAHGAGDRVFCLPPVPSAEVVAAAAGADAGVWSLPNLCKNFYYSLPNKIFEYLAAGLPILGADFPEVRRIVNCYEVGLCFDPYDPKSIAARINRMIDDPAMVRRFRANVPAALVDMQADREWERLVELYRGLEAGQAA